MSEHGSGVETGITDTVYAFELACILVCCSHIRWQVHTRRGEIPVILVTADGFDGRSVIIVARDGSSMAITWKRNETRTR